MTASSKVHQSISESRRNKIRKIKTLREQAKRLGKTNLFFLCKEILGYTEAAEQPHKELCDFISLCEASSKKRLLILLPRGSFKTSLVTIGYTIQRVLRQPNIRILLTGEDLAKTKQFLSEIKGHFESERFEAIFGKWSHDPHSGVWTNTHINVKPRMSTAKEFTITAAGLKVTKVGLHYDLIIADDLVSDKNITTPELMKSVIKYYKLLLSILEPNGTLIIIGTRWHYGELYGYLLEKDRERLLEGKKQRFEVLEKGCYDGPTGLYFPTRLTHEFLEEQKVEQGPFIFSCQYLNKPTDDESAEFKKSNLRFYRKLPKRLNVFLLCDPGGSKKGDDYNAFVSVGISKLGRVYVLRAWRGYCDPFKFCHKLVDEVLRLRSTRHPPLLLGMETAATQKTYKWIFQEVRKERGISIPLRELKPDTRVSKEMRIRGFIPIVAKRLLYLPGDAFETLTGHVSVLADEMIRFPKGSTDDLLDALAYIAGFYYVPEISKRKREVHPGSMMAMFGMLENGDYLNKVLRSRKAIIWGVDGV